MAIIFEELKVMSKQYAVSTSEIMGITHLLVVAHSEEEALSKVKCKFPEIVIKEIEEDTSVKDAMERQYKSVNDFMSWFKLSGLKKGE